MKGRPSRSSSTWSALVVTLVAALSGEVSALEAKVTEFRASGLTLRAALDLKDAIPDRFKIVLREGGILHVRVETELWEDRSVWDRLVQPARVAVFRLALTPATQTLSLSDRLGPVATFDAYPDRLSVPIDVVPVSLVEEARRYYVHAKVVIGTLAEREIEGASEAVFGAEGESGGLGTVGRAVFSRMLKLARYLQSISCETTGPTVSGKQIRGPR